MMEERKDVLPSEIGRANQHDVKIRWQDGHESVYPARELRLKCPCAGCIDEMTGAVRVIATSIPQDVRPLKIELIGNYAITIHWSDGHHTGIYAFDRLRKMCPCCQKMGQGTGDMRQGTGERQEDERLSRERTARLGDRNGKTAK